MRILCLLVLFACLSQVFAHHAFDISSFQGDPAQKHLFVVISRISHSNCLKQNNYNRAIIQVFRSDGVPSYHAPYQVHACHLAGITDIQYYMFPDARKGVDTQVKEMVKYMNANNMHNGRMMWIDIEAPRLFKSTCAANVRFLKEIIASLGKHYKGPVGVYSSESQWTPIMCGSTAFSHLPLWWPRYDNNKYITSGWKNFGGWTKPAMKQFAGDKVVCGQDLDQNEYY